MFTSDMTPTTNINTYREVAMSFSTIPHGLLPAGTITEHGTIECRTDTAYKMVDGSFVAFAKVHGPYKAATPLVVLR